MFEYQGSRLRLKRSHLRPKILICEKFLLRSPLATIYIYMLWHKNLHARTFFLIVLRSHLLLCSRIKLKLKDDTHQSFSGKKFQTVLVSAAQQRWCTQSAKRSSSCAAWDRLKWWRRASAEKPCLFRAQLEQTSTGKAVSSVDTGNIVNNSHL